MGFHTLFLRDCHQSLRGTGASEVEGDLLYAGILAVAGAVARDEMDQILVLLRGGTFIRKDGPFEAILLHSCSPHSNCSVRPPPRTQDDILCKPVIKEFIEKEVLFRIFQV